MRKLLFSTLTLLTLSFAISSYAQQGAKSKKFTIAGPDSAINLVNTAIAWHQLTWNVSGTASACTVALDTSTNGTSWSAGGAITGQTCTSNGSSSVVNVSANYVRIDMTALTISSGGSVTVTWDGWTSNPGGGGSGNITGCTTSGGIAYENGTSNTLTCSSDLSRTAAGAIQSTVASVSTPNITLFNASAASGVTNTEFIDNSNTFELLSQNASYNSYIALLPQIIYFQSTGTQTSILELQNGNMQFIGGASGSFSSSVGGSFAGPISSTSDGVHAGNLSLTGNGTAVTPAANTANILGPSSSSFTAYGLQLPAVGPPAISYAEVGAQSSAVSQVSFLNPAFVAQTDNTTVTWAIGGAIVANASLLFTVHSGSRTLNITNPINGGSYVIQIQQDATGGEGLTLGSGCTWKVSSGGSGAITPSTGANAIDVLAFTYDGTNCYANFNKNFN